MRLVQLIFLSTLGQRGDKNYLDLGGFEPSLATEQASKQALSAASFTLGNDAITFESCIRWLQCSSFSLEHAAY